MFLKKVGKREYYSFTRVEAKKYSLLPLGMWSQIYLAYLPRIIFMYLQ